MPFDTMIKGKDGKLTWLLTKQSSAHQHSEHKRYRATVVIIKDGRVLLVRDKNKKQFSLPGGGFKHGETTIEAGAREIREELGLVAQTVERLRHCDCEGRETYHKVCQAALNESFQPRIRDGELAEFTWWDMRSRIPVFDHVEAILSKAGVLFDGE